MLIHLSVLLIILVVSLFYEKTYCSEKLKVIAEGGVASDYKATIIPWLIVLLYIAFLSGMRDYMNDTSVYTWYFESASGTWEEINEIIYGSQKDKGFYILQSLVKMFVKDYHLWFLFVSVIEAILLALILRRETVSFIDSCFLLFSSYMYYNFFTMMRQWLAVCIVFFAYTFLLNRKKYLWFVVVCVLAAQFHFSASFFIPIAYFVIQEAWSKKQYILLFIISLLILFFQPIVSVMGITNNEYDYVFDALQSGNGSSWIRIIIAFIPVVIAYIKRDTINKNDKMINTCINMSILNLVLTIIATFTSGLFVSRMATYTSVFLLILYPYLFNVCFNEQNRKTIKLCFYVLYFVSWLVMFNHGESIEYYSTVLGITMQN